MCKFSDSIMQKHFPHGKVSLYELVINHAFIKKASLLDDVRFPDVEATHESLQHVILNTPVFRTC